MAGVRFWSMVHKTKVQAYNSAVRASGLDPGILDSMEEKLWDIGDNPEADEHIWLWNSWLMIEDDADEMVTIMIARGPVNVPGPEGRSAYYRSDEAETGPSTTAAPIGGWTNELILADRLRKPVTLKTGAITGE